jgi:hypothetical protein
MQVFSANPHSHPQFPVSALSIKAVQDNVEGLLSSDLEISFASSMSLNSSLPGPIKPLDNAGRDDIVPMDISFVRVVSKQARPRY